MAGFKSEVEGGTKSAFSGVGKIMAGAFAGVAVGDFLKGAVQQAASVQKATEAIKAQFGGASKAVIDFGNTAATKLGISASTADEAAAKFGILFHNMGITQTVGAGMTLGMEKLVGSLSMVRNMNPADVMDRMTLALAGNTRGLKQLGIAIDPAMMKQAALKLGLISSVKDALTPATKAQAIYALATQNLGYWQAQAKKHSGDLADQTKVLSAEWANAKERIGSGLLPVVSKLVGVLAADLPAAMGIVTGVFKAFFDTIKTLFGPLITNLVEPLIKEFDKLKGILTGGGSIGDAFKQLKTDFQNLSAPAKIAVVALGGIAIGFAAVALASSPITAVILAVVGLTEGLKALYDHSAKFRAIVADITNYMQSTVEPMFNRVAKVIVDAFGGAIKYVQSILPGLERIFREVITVVTALWDRFGGTIESIAKTYFKNIWTVIKDTVKIIEDVIKAFIDLFTGNWSGLWNDIKGILGAALNIIESTLSSAASILGDLARAAGKAILDGFKWGFDQIEHILMAMVKKIAGVIAGFLSSIPTSIFGISIPGLGGLHHFAEAMKKWADGGKQLGTTAGDAATTALNTAFGSGAGGFAAAVSNAVNSAFSGSGFGGMGGLGSVASSAMVRIGQNTILGTLKSQGWTPDQLKQVRNLMNYEDASGKPGDHNTSFGPRQLHAGGQLPNSVWAKGAAYAQDWAWSKAGLQYAAQGFSQFGGLHGAALAQALAGKQGSSNIRREAAATLGGPILPSDWTASGTSTAASTAASKAAKAAQAIANAKTSLELTFKGIKTSAAQLGGQAATEVGKQITAISKQLAGVSSKQGVVDVRHEITALRMEISTDLRRAKTEAGLVKVFDGLKTQAKELGSNITPDIRAKMAVVRGEISKVATPAEVNKTKADLGTLRSTIKAELTRIREEVSLSHTFQGLETEIGRLHNDVTPQLKTQMKTIRDEISKVTTPQSAQLIKNQMTRVKSEVASDLKQIQASISATKTQFDNAWRQLASGADTIFDRETAKAIKAMQVQVQGAFGTFAFGGGITQTPSEILMKQLQDQKTAMDQADALKLAQDKQANDQVANSGATADQLIQDAKDVANAQYDIKITALQEQATIERTAADKQLADAQTAYQQSRDLLKQQMDDRLALIEQGMLDGTMAAKAGMDALTGVLGDPQYGLDMQNSGLVIGANLYTGLQAGMAPVFDLVNSLTTLMANAGLLDPAKAAASVAAAASKGNPQATLTKTLQAQNKTTSQILAELEKQTKLAEKNAANDKPIKVTVAAGSSGGSANQTARDALR